MSQTVQPVWTALQKAGLVQGPAPEPGKLESPWYVKLLLAFSGWLAALFLLGFIGAGFQFILKSGTAAFVAGAMMIAGAYVILRMPKNEFYEHLALAVSLAGQALVVWAIFTLADLNAAATWLWVALLQVPLALFMPNFVHRVFSSAVATQATSLFLTSTGAPAVFSAIVMFIATWLWLNEFRYPGQIRTVQAIGYGLVLALMQLKGSALFGFENLRWLTGAHTHTAGFWNQPWVGEMLTGVVTLYVVWQLLQRRGRSVSEPIGIAALLGTLLLSAVSMQAWGITLGVVIMLLGFSGGNRVLMGLGAASLLFYISAYYYLLDATLLTKAQNLLIIGLVLLATRWAVLRIACGEKESGFA